MPETPPAPDHDVPSGGGAPGPLTPAGPAGRRTPAEEARALVAAAAFGTLASLASDGTPWASMVAVAPLPDGSPVLCVSTLAEHGRNLARDGRGSISVVEVDPPEDPLACGRVTLAGTWRRPEGTAAAEAYHERLPGSRRYTGFGDFGFWVLTVERVRWVGGYGRMDTVDAPAYAAAEVDPVLAQARGAVHHLNEDHADALLDMARGLAGFPDATSARCTRADRYGLDLDLATPRGATSARVGFARPVDRPDGLRAATVELAHRARGG